METEVRDWFPIRAALTATGIQVVLSPIPVSAFTDAFAHETIARHSDFPVHRLVLSWHDLRPYREPNPSAAPRGIIMHTARVGSTVQVRLLRCISSLGVYSEPPAINDVLMPPCFCDRPNLVAALRFVVALIGQHAGTRFVIKLRSWNSLLADVITEAFPSTPWIFAVRNPIEVGVSVQRRPPTWMRLRGSPGNPFLCYARPFGDVDTAEGYLGAMLAAFYDSIDRICHRRGKVVDYRELPSAVWERVCPHFELPVSPEEVHRMRWVSRFDAKAAVLDERVFVPDSAEKRTAAWPPLLGAVHTVSEPALYRLLKRFDLTVSDRIR